MIEFRYSENFELVKLKLDDGEKTTDFKWGKAARALSLLFLDYCCWENGDQKFEFPKLNEAELARTVGYDSQKNTGISRNLFIRLKGGAMTPRVAQIFKIRYQRGKSIPAAINILWRFLPSSRVEIVCAERGKLENRKDILDLANRIRIASGFLPETKYPLISTTSGLEMNDAGQSEINTGKINEIKTVEMNERVDWGDFLKQSPKMQFALKQYPAKYNERHGQIKVLGMSRPILLKEIYVEAVMADPALLRSASILRDSKGKTNKGKNRDILPEGNSPISGFEMANEVRFLNVLGQPGGGKSVFLRRIGLEALLPIKVRRYEHDCTPVFVELKNFNVRQLHLEEIIKNEFTAFGFPESFAEVALKNGKLLILLDGIDEVPSDNLNHVVNDIRRFVENNSSNRFIISSRTEFYQNWFSRFTDISVAEFRSDQIRSFLKNWFQVHNAKEKGKAKKFWEMLTWPKNKTFLELAGRPILLVHLCRRVHVKTRLPRGLDISYDEAVEGVLKNWASEKMICSNSMIDQQSEITAPTGGFSVFLT